jgi:hypothetical protein
MKIFVLEREKVMGGWRQYFVMVHFIIKGVRWVGHVACT